MNMEHLEQPLSSQDNDSNHEMLSSPGSHSSLYEPIIKDEKRAFKCVVDNCEKIFRFKSDMERHVIIHRKDKPYICQTCNKTFKRPDALKNHVQIHNKDFPFVCDVAGCDAKFHKKTALKYHLAKHTNDKTSSKSSKRKESVESEKPSEQDQSTKIDSQEVSPPSPLSSPKDLMDLDCFFNPFGDLNPGFETPLPYQSTRTSFDDEFSLSPKSEKFIHTEAGRATLSLNIDQDSDHSTASFDEICKLPIPEIPENANLPLKDFMQIVICKYLLQENKQLKAKLAIESSPAKIEYENNLHALLKKAFGSQFDLNVN